MTMSESKPTDLLAAAASELSAERTYCKGCGYSLHRLPQPRCPECGCDFDPDDSSTTTKERGERQRFRYATSCLAACITLTDPEGGRMIRHSWEGPTVRGIFLTKYRKPALNFGGHSNRGHSGGL